MQSRTIESRSLSENIAVLNKRIKRATTALSGRGSFLSNVRQATRMLYGDKDSLKFKIPKNATEEERKKIEQVVKSLLENKISTARGRKQLVKERLTPVLQIKFGISDKMAGDILKIFDSDAWEKVRELSYGYSDTVVDLMADTLESGASVKDVKKIIANYANLTGVKPDFMYYFSIAIKSLGEKV